MTALIRALALCVVAAFALVACGASESDQRAAFIDFLEKDVLAKQGTRVPQLTEERRKAFGDYAAQYDIITRFHEAMNASVAEPMKKIIAGGAPRTIQEAVERKPELISLREGVIKLRDALDQTVAAADKAKAALNQPPDLAPVFASAYDKLVTKPAQTFRETFPATEAAFSAVISFGELIEQNRAKVKVDGSMIETADQKLRERLQAAMSAMNDKRIAVNAAQQKLRAQLYGN